MGVYVLIHGAWHGSWCWKYIKSYLEQRECVVYTPDLPGHFENKCNLKKVTFSSYVWAVENLINSLSEEVVLVGHSMAGAIISQVANNIPNKIKSLVYVAGFIPENGCSIFDEEKRALKPCISKEVLVAEDSIIISDSLRVKHFFYNCCSNADCDYAMQHIQPQPLMPFSGKVALSQDNISVIPKVYIECLQDNAVAIEDQRRMYGKVCCDVITLDCDHSPFLSQPEELTKILLNVI